MKKDIRTHPTHMNLSKSTCTWLATLLALIIPYSSPAPLVYRSGEGWVYEKPTADQRVGELGDPNRIVFEGAAQFTPEALRLGLKMTPGFWELSHPLAPLGEYLAALERKLRLGYQHNGFPEACVTVKADDQAGHIRVTIDEGPRFMCDAVKVTGGKKLPIARIIERLTIAPVHNETASESVESMFGGASSTMRPMTDADAEALARSASLWTSNQPAHFSEVALSQLSAVVTNVLQAHGFFAPKVSLRVERHDRTKTATLLVEIPDAGPRVVVDQVEIVGLKRNTREAVLKYIGVKPGAVLTTDLMSAIENRLWQSARFLTQRASLGKMDPAGRTALRIEVVEYDELPPLGEKLSRTEQAMLKMREWFLKFTKRKEDLVVTINAPARSLTWQGIISPRQGLAVLQLDTSPQTNSLGYALLMRPQALGFFAPDHQRKLIRTGSEIQVTASLGIDAKPAKEDESPFNIFIGAGFKNLPEAEPGKPPPPPFRMDLNFAPVAFAHSAHLSNSVAVWKGSLLICSNATDRIQVNARTGQLLEFTMQAVGSNDFRIAMSFERGAFDRATQRIERETAQHPNAYNTNAPLSSAVAFAMAELAQSKALASLFTNVPVEKLARLSGVLQKLKPEDILSPLNQLASGDIAAATNAEAFLIPESLETPRDTMNAMIALGGNWLIENSGRLFAASSWPWTLAREAGCVVQGNTRYTDQVLQGVFESDQTGPLGFLSAAKLLMLVNPKSAKVFAQQGLLHLSASDFRQDCRLLLQGDGLVSQCCVNLVKAMQQLDKDEIDALAATLSGTQGEFLKDCWTAVREAGGKPLPETLGPALDAYWQKELRAQVRSALLAIVKAEVRSE